MEVSLGELGREPVSRGVTGFLGLTDWRSFMWFPAVGGRDWCVDGGDQCDSFRAGRFSRENAGLGGWEAKENGKREIKVMTPGSRLAEVSEEERGSTGVGSLPIEMQSES